MGIDPYPAAEFPTNAFSTEIKESFKDDEDREVVIAGRMMSRRVMGKASFAELQDSKGRIQVYITRDDICPGESKDLYNNVFKRLLDIGDFIGVKGKVFRTQTGEISVHASELTLLSKSLKPLPIVKYKDGVAYDKFDDPELRSSSVPPSSAPCVAFSIMQVILRLTHLSCRTSLVVLQHAHSSPTSMRLIRTCICVLLPSSI